MRRKSLLQVLALTVLLLLFTAREKAQTSTPRALITQAIDESKLVTLGGNTRPEANSRNDLGPAGYDLHLDMYLQLKRSPDLERAAAKFVESLTDKASPNFHKWIAAAEYGRRFGAAPEDIATVSRWLQSHGFTVNAVPSNNMVIDFSGSAGQVREALHTEIHTLEIAGKRYFANISDPQIPAALLPAVTGVVSLHNFRPRPLAVPKAQYTISNSLHAIVPGDLATIYNLNPAFAAGYTGLGQTVVVFEDTDLYSGTNDWNTFRKTFGLTAQFPFGTLTQVHPTPGNGGSTCYDPGVNGDDSEAALDVEWASAAAPNAAIVMASCEDTTNFGGFIALQNMLTNGGALPSVVSISYGEAETQNGAAENSYINTLYQTAAAAGVSVFVSAGDSAAAASDRDGVVSIYGIGVSAFASTPYNVAVGGTDFGDYAAGTTNTFWSPSNGAYYNSAKSYIPEIPWNQSCGSGVAANYLGFSATYGAAGFCNAFPDYADTVGGGGGPSGCATGTRTLGYSVSGTCAGWAKPSWQSIPGNPNDGVRDLPDVSLFAAAGFWGHYYVFCFSAEASCSLAPSNWAGAGGTSFSSPIMAGIQAVINQALGTNNVGNPNPVYYQIGSAQYATSAGTAACSSTTGPLSTCSFNDVTQGDMVIPCSGTVDCFTNGQAVGVLSTSNSSYEPAYATTPGWDFATGIGTVNAFNLLNAFVGSVAPSGAPLAPLLVSPADAATGVLPAPTLIWTSSAGATSYDVYFGAAAPPPLVANVVGLNYAPGALAPSTTYYWAVGARNSVGATASKASSFTTGCVSALSPAGASVLASGGSGAIPVTAPSGCAWTAASNAAWIAITSGATGSGNGTVAYTVAAATGAQRSGTITVAGQTFTVTQSSLYPLISTLAGGAMPSTTGPAASVSIPVSFGVAVDSAGNVYFSSPTLNSVFKANPSGVVTRIAGTGVAGQLGDGGPALSAELNSPNGVAVDSQGNVYISDTNNYRVTKVDTTGVMTTVAGDGGYGYSGDTGPATIAEMGYPYGLALDSNGNLYIADAGYSVVRKVDASGTITTVAGNGTYGYSGDGGPATSAEFRDPYGLTVDSSGNLYIADTFNYRIRFVSATSGNVTTVAGNGNCCFNGDGNPATISWLDAPSSVALDASGNLYIADRYNSRIRKVTAGGTILTVVGSGTYGYVGDGSSPTSAELRYPEAVAVDSSGNLYIADSGNARIRQVSAGTITTLVGGSINDGGLGVLGQLNQPSGVARDSAGNTYIADTNNNRVRKVAPNGAISTVAGTGASGYFGDGAAAAGAQLNAPQAVAVGAAGLYIADTGNYRIRLVDSSGNITTVAGAGKCCGRTGDGGPATSAQIGTPYGLALDAAGDLFFSDTSNSVVREVDTSGNITTVAGNTTYGFSGDGGPAVAAEMRDPWGIAVDSSGDLYIADRYNYRVRMVSASGTISTVAGTGNCCFTGDGGAANKADLYEPNGVAVDASGNLYIADLYNERIRMVSTAGTITTVAGNGNYNYSGDGTSAIGATFRYPYAIAIDSSGNLVVADQNNNAIRLLTPAGTQPVLSIQSTHTGPFTPGQNGATYALTVTNGTGAGPTTATVVVTEILPAGLTLTGISGPGWTCSTASAACTRSDALNGASSYPQITVTVNVSGTAPSQLTNQASVTGAGANFATTQDLTIIQ